MPVLATILLCLLVSAPQPSFGQVSGLPDSSGELKGTLKRGLDGRLRLMPGLPTDGSDAGDRDAQNTGSAGPLLPPGSPQTRGQSVQWAMRRLGAIAGFDHQRQARAQQAEIDALVARERQRKAAGAGTNANRLTMAEQQLTDRLRARDQEVRRHEARHYEAGRPFTELPRFWFVVGPDGRRYAVSGAVSFKMGAFSGQAHELLHQLSVLQRAALAPSEPSAQDLSVARAIDDVINELRSRAALTR